MEIQNDYQLFELTPGNLAVKQVQSSVQCGICDGNQSCRKYSFCHFAIQKVVDRKEELSGL